MIYKKFQDIELSNLAMGAMRLPVIDGNDAAIDEAAAFEMVDLAMAQGVNYYDTAWGYHGGNSELVMGRALARHPREKFYLADKFPGYDLANMDKVEEIFETQLKKCGVEYFDFYLFHNVCELNIDGYLDEKFGIHKYLMEQKRNGRIRHLGFSSHGSLEVMERFLDAYGDDMEFCQLQLNYVDWTFQKAKEKAELISRRGLPIWVMEPLRGGLLANLPEKAAALLGGMPPVEWAYRFLQSVPGVTVVLSGASSMEQMKENLRIFAADRQRTDAAHARGGRDYEGGYGDGSMHGMPLLRIALPAGARHPVAARALQRARIHGRRLHRADGAIISRRRQKALSLRRLPQLRAGLPAADKNFRGHVEVRRAAEREEIAAKRDALHKEHTSGPSVSPGRNFSEYRRFAYIHSTIKKTPVSRHPALDVDQAALFFALLN